MRKRKPAGAGWLPAASVPSPGGSAQPRLNAILHFLHFSFALLGTDCIASVVQQHGPDGWMRLPVLLSVNSPKSRVMAGHSVLRLGTAVSVHGNVSGHKGSQENIFLHFLLHLKSLELDC